MQRPKWLRGKSDNQGGTKTATRRAKPGDAALQTINDEGPEQPDADALAGQIAAFANTQPVSPKVAPPPARKAIPAPSATAPTRESLRQAQVVLTEIKAVNTAEKAKDLPRLFLGLVLRCGFNKAVIGGEPGVDRSPFKDLRARAELIFEIAEHSVRLGKHAGLSCIYTHERNLSTTDLTKMLTFFKAAVKMFAPVEKDENNEGTFESDDDVATQSTAAK